MIRIMHALCTGNNCVAKDNFPLMMFEMDNKDFNLFILLSLQIRIFSYGVGPIANPLAAVKWIACANRGGSLKIPRRQYCKYYRYNNPNS